MWRRVVSSGPLFTERVVLVSFDRRMRAITRSACALRYIRWPFPPSALSIPLLHRNAAQMIFNEKNLCLFLRWDCVLVSTLGYTRVSL